MLPLLRPLFAGGAIGLSCRTKFLANARNALAAAINPHATALSLLFRARRAAVTLFCSAASLGANDASALVCCCRSLMSWLSRGARVLAAT